MKTLVRHIGTLRFQLLLLLAAAIWGLGTVLIKSAVDEIPPFWLVGIRFFSAGLILCAAFLPQLVKLCARGELARHLKVGLILGTPMIVGYIANTWGLTDTTAAKSSFLSGLYCVLVPFLAWFLMRRRPTLFNISAAVLCLAGIGLVSLYGKSDFAISWGDGITLFSAVMFGVQVVLTSKFAPGMNMMAITAIEFIFGGAMALCVASLVEAPPSLAILMQPDVLGSVAYIVVFATCAALLLQNVGLAKVSPSSGALLLSFESVFGVIFSVAFLGEALTVAMVCGFALIFSAVLVSEWLPNTQISKVLNGQLGEARRRVSVRFPQGRRVRSHALDYMKPKPGDFDRGMAQMHEVRTDYNIRPQGQIGTGAGPASFRN